MKRILFLLTIVLALSSCSTYYFVQLDSDDPYLERNEKNDFVVNSDSVEIRYSFSGENAPTKVTIKNKMKQRLFVNWRESWLIIGDGDSNRVNLGQYMDDWEGITAIAPSSERETSLLELSNLGLDKIDNKYYADEIAILSNGETKKLKTIGFSEQDTPLYFRYLLSLHVGSSQNAPLYFEQDFYIASVSKAKNMNPYKLAAISGRYGDYFYTVKEHGRKFLGVLDTTGQVLFIGVAIVVGVLYGEWTGDTDDSE